MHVSQNCQGFVRNLRSTSTTYSTIVNCNLLESVHRIQRLQFKADYSVADFFRCRRTSCPSTDEKFKCVIFENQDSDIFTPTVLLGKDCILSNLTLIEDVILYPKQDAFCKASYLSMGVKIKKTDYI